MGFLRRNRVKLTVALNHPLLWILMVGCDICLA